MKRRKPLQELPSSSSPSIQNFLHPVSPHISDEEAEPSTDRSHDRNSEKDEFFADFPSPYELDEYGIPCQGSDGELELNAASSPSCKQAEISDGSFAESFYGSGADWSSLHHVEAKPKRKASGKLVQASLSTLWGLKREETPLNSDSASGKLVQASLSALWGLKRNGTPSNSDSVRAEAPSNSTHRRSKPDKSGGSFGSGMTRQLVRACPFYKKVTGTTFTVDAFRYGSVDGCTAYFLTHFHSDHYGGLSKHWSHGPIYCTSATARLLALCLSVDTKFIHPLEVDSLHVIDGIRVQMLEANHCPGAALIYFGLKDGRHVLHTGDFRACEEMQSYPVLRSAHIHTLYLDTTYCNSKYRFPLQKDVIDYVVKVTKNVLSRDPKTLVVVGAYSIGKERVFLGIAKALGVQIHADSQRRRILASLHWPELSERLCSDARCTMLHVLPMSSLHPEKLKQYLQKFERRFTSVLAFRPTGWTYSSKVGNLLDSLKPVSKSNITIYGVPYSEHSSFSELQEFVQFLRPEKIIATVNVGSSAQRDLMQSYFRQWLAN